MIGLNVLYLLIILAMIFAMGCWQHRECKRRRRVEFDAALERSKIREIAERAASDAASCVAVIDRVNITPLRRRLHVVRDDHAGVPDWHWE